MPSKVTTVYASSLPVRDISDQVKKAILTVYGINNASPDSLDSHALLSNFDFNDYQWMALAFSLTRIIRNYNPDQVLTAPDLKNLLTVQDCIDLVIQKSGS